MCMDAANLFLMTPPRLGSDVFRFNRPTLDEHLGGEKAVLRGQNHDLDRNTCQAAVLILMVFLIACTLHIMIDLLPKLEKRAAGADGEEGGCQCAQHPGRESQGWGKQRARSAAEAGWPNKHTLRILQDFSNEPSSNLTSHSLEKNAAGGDRARDSRGRTGPSAKEHKSLIGDASGGRTVSTQALSQLSALFEHSLYKVDLPPLTDDDTLFNVNNDFRFYPRDTGNQGW
ncbi:hypothetical protein GOODEAATRI_003594 [Goodea atripinnis]|uniref:Uncharacterized protein n=1 Tax=Goodea atripinnis TaxID=208336 RepID=A0ABV0NI91_9TELE